MKPESLWAYACALMLDHTELSHDERLSAALGILDVGIGRMGGGPMLNEIDTSEPLFPWVLWDAENWTA